MVTLSSTMALTSVFVRFYPDYDVSISTIASRIRELVNQNVSRVDYGCCVSERYCIVHFDQYMPEIIWNMLSAKDEMFETDQGPILVGVNQTNGLNPKHDIMQFLLNDDGLYCRYFKSGIVLQWNPELKAWVDTNYNPFL